jgi:DNA-binding transcriptional MerR regulator/methylmalonyl-CoA mutase cobalamin-binding subunit
MFESYGDEPIYNVKAVVGQAGVSASTLRAWERRYGVPTPPRNTNGYRLYSARDVAIIRWLKTQVDAGMTISHAVNLMQIKMAAVPVIERHDTAQKAPALAGGDGVRNYQQLHDELVACALSYDEFGAEKILSEAFSLFAVEDVCLQLLRPVLVTIGEGWHRGETSISAEHFITNIIRRKLLSLISASPPPTRSERIIIGCAPEEFHEIGILLIALFLRRRGLNVVYLGQNVATARLEETLVLIRPAMVILSATTIQSATHLLETAELLAFHKAHSVTIAYGGLIFKHLERMRAHIPAIYLGNDLITGIDRAIVILDDPAANRVEFALVSATMKAAAGIYDLRQAEIVLRATHEMLSVVSEQNATLHHHVFELNRQLGVALGTALRFGEPQLLNQLIAYGSDGLSAPNAMDKIYKTSKVHDMAHCIDYFRSAIKQLAPESPSAIISSYLDAYSGSSN